MRVSGNGGYWRDKRPRLWTQRVASVSFVYESFVYESFVYESIIMIIFVRGLGVIGDKHHYTCNQCYFGQWCHYRIVSKERQRVSERVEKVEGLFSLLGLVGQRHRHLVY